MSTERRLWDRGIHSWDHLRENMSAVFRHRRSDEIARWLDDSERAWESRDLHFFYRNLPRPELWRLVPGFFEEIAFLDIETNGLALPPSSQSTTITIYFRGVVYQAHEHAEKAILVREVLDSASIVCTFFGEVFDLPFLRKEFGLELAKAHLDLCFWLKRLGYQGGLKKVEKQFDDIPRRQSLDIDGFDAVRLWWMHCRGVKGALETLLAYNAEDTVVLEPLLIKAFNFEVENRPHLGLTKLEMRPMPRLPTEVSPAIYQKLRTTDV